MKNLLKKIKENKALKIIGNILYVLLFIIVILMLIVVILQRMTDNSISLGGFRLFTVATGSMEPKYKVGDILISKQVDANEIQVGDDIVYKGKQGSFKDKVVTHQVVSIREENGEKKITTKGIANTEEDPEIDSSQVYGKVIYKVKTLSFIGQIIKNIYVFYFIIFVPIAIIIFRQIRTLLKKDDEEEEEDDDDDDEKENIEEDNSMQEKEDKTRKIENRSEDGDDKKDNG